MLLGCAVVTGAFEGVAELLPEPEPEPEPLAALLPSVKICQQSLFESHRSMLTRTRDSDGSTAGATEGLGGKDLVVVVASLEAVLGPGVEVVGHVNGTRATLVLANGEELAKGLGAGDGGLVDLGVGTDLVGRAVAGQGADLSAGGARVVAVVLNDVVLWIAL